MKNYFLFLILFSVECNFALAQVKDSTNVDLINAPVAPAFSILGIETSSIEEPTTPTDLLVSIKNGFENFKNIPGDYALSFAPVWVFGSSKINYESFKSGTSKWENIKQSLLVSMATHAIQNKDSTTSTQIGFGLKFSILRGKIDEEYDNYRQKRVHDDSILTIVNKKIYNQIEEVEKKDPEWVRLNNLFEIENKKDNRDSTKLDSLLTARDKRDAIINSEDNLLREIQNIKDKVSKIKFERKGFKLDMGLGIGYDFKNKNWDNIKLLRYGIWLTGGNIYHFKNDQSFSWLISSRLLMFPAEQYKNDNTLLSADNLRFDIGGRLIYKLRKKLSISSELLERFVVNNKSIPNTFRFTFNLDYQLYTNQVLTLSLGRDFDGTLTKDGNLIAALNLIMGFGNKRPF